MPSGRRHYRLKLADAFAAHEFALHQYGGAPGIVSLHLIESAIQRPFAGYYRSIKKKAAALVHSGARNHGFVDGNKRTCLLLLLLMLDRSGYRLLGDGTPETNEAVEAMILSVARHEMEFDAIEAWMAVRIRAK